MKSGGNRFVIEVEITSIERETDDILRFELASVAGNPLPPFSPGAHVQTFINFDGQSAQNTYSLCGDIRNNTRYTIAIRKHAHQGGSALWHKLPLLHRLRISAPHTNFPLSHRARHHLFIAGGIGITPFMSMMQALADSASSAFELHYAAKSEALCAFYGNIISTYGKQTTFYFSSAAKPERVQRLSPAILCNRPIGTHIYLCGPTSLVDDFSQYALELGYPLSNIHRERFQARQNGSAKAFSVYLAKKNQYIHVNASESLLQALERYGHNVPFACRVGGCGTCKVDVLSGEVLHLDDFYTDEEHSQIHCMLACVSRAKSSQLIIHL